MPRNLSWRFLTQLLDKRFGFGHGMYNGAGDTVFLLDIQHYPIAKCCKRIDFALHILCLHPGLTAIEIIEKNDYMGHSGPVL